MTADSTRVKVWDLPLRLFHWLLVAAIAIAFLSAEEGSPLNQWHVLAGWVAGVLILFRLAWGFVGGEHSRFSDFIRPSRIAHHLDFPDYSPAELKSIAEIMLTEQNYRLSEPAASVPSSCSIALSAAGLSAPMAAKQLGTRPTACVMRAYTAAAAP